MAWGFNPFTGKLDNIGYTLTALDARYIKLDGTTTTTGSIPFALGIQVYGFAATPTMFINMNTASLGSYNFYGVDTAARYDITLPQATGTLATLAVLTQTFLGAITFNDVVSIPSTSKIKFEVNAPAASYIYLTNNTTDAAIPPEDGFRIRWMNTGVGLGANNDALIFEKTDGNDANPDGAIQFVMTGSDGAQDVAMNILGSGSVVCKSHLVVPQAKKVGFGADDTTLSYITLTAPFANTIWLDFYVAGEQFMKFHHFFEGARAVYFNYGQVDMDFIVMTDGSSSFFYVDSGLEEAGFKGTLNTRALIPEGDDSYDIGTAILRYQDSFKTGRSYYIDTNAYVYATSSTNLVCAGSGTTTIGVAGSIILGDGTERIMYPHTTLKMNLGSTTNLFNKAYIGGGTYLGSTTNYSFFGTTGIMTQVGTARINWTKITAESLTLTAGTSASAVADLQVKDDARFYTLHEAAATPGIDMYVEFTGVTAFNWVQILATYNGSSTHSIAVQLYNWTDARWDTFDSIQTGQEDVSTASGYILDNHDFFVPSDTKFISTGGSTGKVRVRFYHTMAGNASYHLYIDVVALYQ